LPTTCEKKKFQKSLNKIFNALFKTNFTENFIEKSIELSLYKIQNKSFLLTLISDYENSRKELSSIYFEMF